MGAKELSNPLSLGGAVLFDRSLMRVAGGAGKATGGLGLQVLERKAPGLWRELTGQVGGQELRRGALPTLQRFGGRWLIAGSEGAGSLPVFKAGGSTATGKLETIPHDLATGPGDGAASGIGGALAGPLTSNLPRAMWLWDKRWGRGLGAGHTLKGSLESGLGLGISGTTEAALRPMLNPAFGESRHLDLDPKRLALAFGEKGLEGLALGAAGSIHRLRSDLTPYPSSREIRKRPRLSPAERRAEELFAAQLERDWDKAVADYRVRFGNQVGLDDAKRLSTKYFSSPDYRVKNDTALSEPARTLSREVLDRMLAEPTPPDKQRIVTLLAGGPGSGKTSSLDAASRNFAEIIVDSTLSNYATAKGLVDQARGTGRSAHVVYIHRPIADAVKSAVNRAMDPADGRPVTLLGLAKAHFGAQQTYPRLLDEYGDGIRASIRNNSGAKGKATPMKREELAKVSYSKVEEAIRDAKAAYFREREQRTREGRPIPHHIDRAFRAGISGR